MVVQSGKSVVEVEHHITVSSTLDFPLPLSISEAKLLFQNTPRLLPKRTIVRAAYDQEHTLVSRAARIMYRIMYELAVCSDGMTEA